MATRFPAASVILTALLLAVLATAGCGSPSERAFKAAWAEDFLTVRILVGLHPELAREVRTQSDVLPKPPDWRTEPQVFDHSFGGRFREGFRAAPTIVG
jgi:hypothetical protein